MVIPVSARFVPEASKVPRVRTDWAGSGKRRPALGVCGPETLTEQGNVDHWPSLTSTASAPGEGS